MTPFPNAIPRSTNISLPNGASGSLTRYGHQSPSVSRSSDDTTAAPFTSSPPSTAASVRTSPARIGISIPSGSTPDWPGAQTRARALIWCEPRTDSKNAWLTGPMARPPQSRHRSALACPPTSRAHPNLGPRRIRVQHRQPGDRSTNDCRTWRGTLDQWQLEHSLARVLRQPRALHIAHGEIASGYPAARWHLNEDRVAGRGEYVQVAVLGVGGRVQRQRELAAAAHIIDRDRH